MLKENYQGASCEQDMQEIRKLHEAKNYFQVIIQFPQLAEKIWLEITASNAAYIERKVGEPSPDDQEVYSLINRLQREESIKARVADCLLDLYESDLLDSGFPKKEFVKYFTKLESIIRCRDQLCHEYYKNCPPQSKQKRASSEAMELLELLAYHPRLYF